MVKARDICLENHFPGPHWRGFATNHYFTRFMIFSLYHFTFSLVNISLNEYVTVHQSITTLMSTKQQTMIVH